MSRRCLLGFLATLPLGRLSLLFLRTGWNMGALTEVRRLCDLDFSMSTHAFVGDIMTGDKLVDQHMYPGLCIDHCNAKGASARQRLQI